MLRRLKAFGAPPAGFSPSLSGSLQDAAKSG
jgi:hypothetical protein